MISYDEYEIKPSKHFVLGWMRKWNFDIEDIRDALKNAYKIDKVGKIKYESYTRRGSSGKSRKIIFVVYEDEKQIFIITGAEGK
ncbi:MAG: hypothetical protein AABW45_01700 [Nanoarchaeota archaeon]